MIEHRPAILEKCREKMGVVMGSRWKADQLENGLPTLYSELVEVLEISMSDPSPDAKRRFVDDIVTASASREHARQSFRQGYTVSQLVHGYGSICQAITEYANEIDASITATEFSQLNLSLDVAIAQAVVEFEKLSLNQAAAQESLRIGFLVHELRNALANATMAYELIKQGGVGASGATSAVLTTSHQRMLRIIDRAMAEVRMQSEPVIHLERLSVFALLSEVESAALPDALDRQIAFSLDVSPEFWVDADRHLLTSAVANLVQNAIKFTIPGGRVTMRTHLVYGNIHIEIEDQCGGLPDGFEEKLFEPYVQAHVNRIGMGLGLPIARRAVELNKGTLSVRNMPGVGCVFTISLPESALGEKKRPEEPEGDVIAAH